MRIMGTFWRSVGENPEMSRGTGKKMPLVGRLLRAMPSCVRPCDPIRLEDDLAVVHQDPRQAALFVPGVCMPSQIRTLTFA